DANGKFIGLRVTTFANVGAYISSERNLLATFGNVGTLTGVYDIPAAHVAVLAVMANTNGTAPYRGAGRPEATYVIERLIDDAARELSRDPVELRRINLIPPAKIPYKNAFGLNYDSGNFPANQQKVLELADWAGFGKRREEARRRGKLRGIALANPIEKAAGKIIAKGKRLAAHLLEAAEADIEFAVGDSGGNFAVAGTDRRITITEVAKAAFQIGRLPPGLEGGLFETGTFSPADTTYPNGSHVCEVEIDAETGELEILNYVVVDDVGTVVNPIGLKGQIHAASCRGSGRRSWSRSPMT